METGPVLVEEIRSDHVQAVHGGHAVVLAADGTHKATWGDPATATFLRSAPKPLQAMSFIESGAMEAFGLNDRALALACASHSAEAAHVRLAREMLAAAGLDEAALRCATHDRMTSHSGPRPEGGWTPIYNNCSGKHAAMLATCVHHGWDIATYLDPGHPLQQEIKQRIERACGEAAQVGVDGCGAPTFWVSVAGLARAFQWLESQPAGVRALDAMAKHPWLVAGTDRFCTALGKASQATVVGKVGAAGVYVAIHRPSGESFALKVTSGVGRAAESLAAALAEHAGWVTSGLEAFSTRPITNCAGAVVGRYRARL